MACDFCTLYTGVIPNERQNKIEIWNRYRVLGGYIGSSSDNRITPTSFPFFKVSHGDHLESPSIPPVYNSRDKIWLNTTELRFSFFLYPRITFLGNIPYVRNIIRINGSVARYSGIGDPFFLIHYFPIWRDNINISYRIGTGIGLKIPMGRFAAPYETAIITHIYPSSGSFDPLGILNIYYRYQKFGIFGFFLYRWSTSNKWGYKFGNSINAQLQVFYNYMKQNTKGFTRNWLPSVGIYYERNEDDIYNQKVFSTQLQSCFGMVGIDYFFSKFNISIAYQCPIYQGTNSIQLGNGGRLNIGIQYNLGSKPIFTPQK
ncbi:MAG: hypothetical protein RML72_08970 [Bacteroidia bacterium]|nr:hypothetical protein [Bacteroidia bacterium]MDW8158987.1 hypothetical protein [Bacteroidia bacterium]